MILKNFSKLKTTIFSLFVINLFLLVFVAQAQATLYLVHDSSPNALYTVDTTTAAVTLVGAGNSGTSEGLALGTDDSFFYAIGTSDPLATIAADGSAFTSIGGSPDGDRGLAFNRATGILYGSDNSDFGVINTTTGSFSALASPGEDTECLAADSVNNLIYGVDGDEDLVVYTVVTDSWAVVGATGVSTGNDCGLAYDPATTTLYFAGSDDTLYRIDPVTASTVAIGSIAVTGGSDYGLAFVSNVPKIIPVLSRWGLLIMLSIFVLIGIQRKSRPRAVIGNN